MTILTGNTIVDIIIVIIIGIVVIMVVGWLLGAFSHPFYGPRLIDQLYSGENAPSLIASLSRNIS
jgi:hypothetical protein